MLPAISLTILEGMNSNSFAVIDRNLSTDEQRRIEEIYTYAKRHIHPLSRKNGESYETHGFEVAATLREGFSDPALVGVALMHGILVHPNGNELLKKSPLTAEEQSLVKKMNNLRSLHIDTNKKDLDRFIDAFLKDIRLIPLRMAHRLNDVRHMDRFHPTLRKKIANETLHMYTSIASRLGLHAWRYEMEDICFKIVHPAIAKDLEKKFKDANEIDEICLSHCNNFLAKKLYDEGLSFRIENRLKTLYSTYRKMVLKRRRFEELTDRLALRVIMEDVKDCYHVLGIVHQYFHPIPGKLKDYIGAPKENGYQSIHTVVYPLPGITEQPIEIQIRTEKMHESCEFGPAAKGEYKNYTYSLTSGNTRVNLLRNFQVIRNKGYTPSQFAETLRTYFYEEHIAVFDMENNLYHMKKPATVLDYVGEIYLKKVTKLKDVRINGRASSIDTVLRDGDIIDVKFGRSRSIKPSWAQACQNKKTINFIRTITK